MTCIVGLINNGCVFMGADSAGVAGYDITVRRDPKLFRVGDMLIGFTSSFRMGQLLGYGFTPPNRMPAADVMQWMATDFVDAVRARFKAGGYAEVTNNREAGGHFLVGVAGRLFHVEGDFQVGEAAAEYDACGCGAPYALGSIAMTGTLPPERRVMAALETAAEFSAGVRRPFATMVLATSLAQPAPPTPSVPLKKGL